MPGYSWKATKQREKNQANFLRLRALLLFVNRHRDRTTNARFWRIQIIYLGSAVYAISFTSYRFIHWIAHCRRTHRFNAGPGYRPTIGGTDLERSLAVYQWLVEARCYAATPCSWPWILAGCWLRPRALALERMWIHSRFGTVGDTSSHPGPSRLDQHSDFMMFCAFCLFCLLSSYDIEKILKPESRR